MIRRVLFILSMLPGIMLLASCSPAQATPTPVPSMPNPAAVYCEQEGGTPEIVTAADGSQSGRCVFSDGSQCDEWAYFRGECQPGDSLVTPSPMVSPTPVPASPTATPVPTDTPEPTVLPPLLIDDTWATYTNDEYGFSFRYPADWKMKEISGSVDTLSGHAVHLLHALTKMIEEFGLYSETVRTNGMDAVVERVRKDIKVETMGARSQRGSGIDSFSISFAHENPTIAMNMTGKLASQFIEENLKVREQLVAGASEFLEQELALAKERLESQEKTISEYKTKHMGELPEPVQANISALDRLQLQHSAAVEAIQKATDRMTLIERMLKEYESPAMAATVQGPGGVVVVEPLVARLRELEKNLTALSAGTKTHTQILRH